MEENVSLGVALIVIVVLFFLIKSKGFRKAALVVLGLGVLVGFLVYLYLEHEKAESARKVAHARTLITRAIKSRSSTPEWVITNMTEARTGNRPLEKRFKVRRRSVEATLSIPVLLRH